MIRLNRLDKLVPAGLLGLPMQDQLLENDLRREVEKHLGPGAHPSGSPQSVHGGDWTGGSQKPRSANEFPGYQAGDKRAAMRWGQRHNRQRSDKDDFLGSLSDYVQNTHFHINRSLREGRKWQGADVSGNVRELDGLLKGRETQESVTVWRGVDEDFFKTLKPGKRFHDRGFVSTTLVKVVVEPNQFGISYDRPFDAVMTIVVPKGIRAYYVGTVGGGYHANEFEFLLQRGLTFEVVSVNRENLSAVLKVVK